MLYQAVLTRTIDRYIAEKLIMSPLVAYIEDLTSVGAIWMRNNY